MLVGSNHVNEERSMNRPHCASTATKVQTQQTSLGYRTFRCSAWKRTFHERSGTPFNVLEYPTDLVLLVVLWRFWEKLGLRGLGAMGLGGGFPPVAPRAAPSAKRAFQAPVKPP